MAALPAVPFATIAAVAAVETSSIPETKIRQPLVLIAPLPDIVQFDQCISRLNVIVPLEMLTAPSAEVPNIKDPAVPLLATRASLPDWQTQRDDPV